MLKNVLLAAMLVFIPTSAFSGTIQEDMLDPVIQITSNDGGLCTAFSLGQGFYLTASHCLGDEENKSGQTAVEVYNTPKLPDNPPDLVSYYKWTGVSDGLPIDLAIIHFSDKAMEKKPVKFANSDPTVGQKVYAIGFPSRYGKTIVEGWASEQLYYDASMILEPNPEIRKAKGIKPKWVERTAASLPVYQGMSGGPRFVYNEKTKTYEVFSVNSIMDLQFPQMSLGPTTAQIKEFVTKTMMALVMQEQAHAAQLKKKQESNQLRLKK